MNDNNLIETITKNGYIAKIYYDDCVEGPRNGDYHDNLSKIYSQHKRYDFNEIQLDNEICETWEDELKALHQQYDIAIIKPLYLLDHGSLTLSTESFGGYNGWFDSGQLGYIMILKADMRKEYSCKRISHKMLLQAEKIMLSELNCFQQYLNGDIYRFTIEDEQGEIIENCGGYYGYDDLVTEVCSFMNHLPYQQELELSSQVEFVA